MCSCLFSVDVFYDGGVKTLSIQEKSPGKQLLPWAFFWFEKVYPAIIKYINTKKATTEAAMITMVLVEIPLCECMVLALEAPF